MDIIRTQTYSLMNSHPKEMEATVRFYRLAVEALSRVALAELEYLKKFGNQNSRRKALEWLVHSTGPRKVKGEAELTPGNKSKYPCFDWLFSNFPSYYMRAAVDDAMGLVSSHVTRSNQWRETRNKVICTVMSPAKLKKKLKKFADPPTFQPVTRKCPTLFKGSAKKVQKAIGKRSSLKARIAGTDGGGGNILWLEADLAAIKLFDGSSWVWKAVRLKHPKKKRFNPEDGWTEMSPSLIQTTDGFKIHVPMEKKVTLAQENHCLKDSPVGFVLAVDLGINTRATTSVVASDGTIHGRFFIDLPRETGSLDHELGVIAQRYRASGQPQDGRKTCISHWVKVGHYSDEIAHQVSAQLVKIAAEHGCSVIVFEHLGRMSVPRDFYGARRLRKKLHYWLQGKIQKFTQQKGHVQGIRFSRVLARGTSANAFDGSGEVTRTGNHKIAIFKNKIRYDADLNASYNIGARYWIREFIKEQPKAAQVLGMATQPQAGVETSKASSRKAKVAGQGITCPVEASPEHSSGRSVARHKQVLASLISLVTLVGGQAATTSQGRIHATARDFPLANYYPATTGSPVQNTAVCV
jgi:IS605 OrfB family transposase